MPSFCVLNCVARFAVVINYVLNFAAPFFCCVDGRRVDKCMPLKESEAIVLRSFPLGEGDRLVSFLDRQSGRLRGVARGARLPKSRFGSTLELLSHIRIWYFERETRELVRINQCEMLESFLDVQRDYQASVCLALISEVTEAVLGEREAADAQFRLVLLTAKAIRTQGRLPQSLRIFRCGRRGLVDGSALLTGAVSVGGPLRTRRSILRLVLQACRARIAATNGCDPFPLRHFW